MRFQTSVLPKADTPMYPHGTLAGQMRQQGAQTEQANVNIMNAFNERMARNLNQYNQYVAEMKNKADLFNLQNQQQREEALVQQRNQQMLEDVRRQEAAAEARRAARERAATTRYGIQSGLGRLQGEAAGQALEKETAAYARGLDAAGRIGGQMTSTGLRGFYGADDSLSSGTAGQFDEDRPSGFGSKMRMR